MLANDGSSKGSKGTKFSNPEEEKTERSVVKKEGTKAINSDKVARIATADTLRAAGLRLPMAPSSSSSSSSSVPDVLPPTKLPPPAVLNLVNESTFISFSPGEEERDRLRRAQMLRSQSQNAAFEAANKPPQVIIPDDLLVKLYVLLGKKAPPITSSTSAGVMNALKEERVQSVPSSYTNPMSCYGVSDTLFHSLSDSSFSSSSSSSFPPSSSSSPAHMAALFNINTPTSPSMLASSYTLEILEEEIESLAAIFSSEFSFTKTISEFNADISVLLCVQLHSFKKIDIRLEVYIVISSLTRTSTSVVPFFSTLNIATFERLLSLQHMLWAHAVTFTQAPIVFDILMWLESQADSMMRDSYLKSSPETEYLLRLTKAPLLAEERCMEDCDGWQVDTVSEEMNGHHQSLKACTDLETRRTSSSAQSSSSLSSSSSSSSFWKRGNISNAFLEFKKPLGNAKLPAFLSKKTFLEMIASSPAAVIVTGETGSGTV